MSVSTTVSPPSIQNCFNEIQHKFYSAQEKVFGLCGTDNKIYVFLILGRVLQATALTAITASVAFTFTIGHLALLAAIPAIAVGILGTYVAGNPEEFNGFLQMSRPFVAGQPTGLPNGGNNCWLNSSLQLLVNTPALHRRMRQIPQFSEFLDAYEKNRTDYEKVAENIDTRLIRQFLSRETSGQIANNHTQEDAAQFFEYLFEGLNSIHQLDQQINGGPATLRREPFIQIDLGANSTNTRSSFQEQFNSYFDHRTDVGQRLQLFFRRSPDNLLVEAKRFYQHLDANGALQEGKITDVIDTPERLSLPNNFVRSGESAEYLCDAFTLHSGGSSNSGHYVCYVKRQGVWWYCSDRTVYEVSASRALNAMKHGYIFHYAKTT